MFLWAAADNLLKRSRRPKERISGIGGSRMSLVIIAFIMVAGLGVAAVLMLEAESRAEQVERFANRRNALFAD